MTDIRALAIVHQDDAGPGVFADAFEQAGFQLDQWMISGGDDPPAEPASYDAVATFGGAMHADQEDLYPWLVSEKALLAGLIERGTPLLGVCLGSQLVAAAAGAEVRRTRTPEIGWHEITLEPGAGDDPVLGFLPRRFTGFGWHSYEADIPPGGTPLARSEVCLQAYRVGESAWGIQFHAEVSAEVLDHWTVNYDEDPDAVAIGLDPKALGARNAQEIEGWNEVGRALCGRFCDYVRDRG